MQIEINHSKLGESAKVIDEYINSMTNYMNLSTDRVNSLTSKNWKYEDANNFKERWSKHSDSTSVTSKMKASLRNYSNSLKYAEGQYKKAQNTALNKANMLF